MISGACGWGGGGGEQASTPASTEASQASESRHLAQGGAEAVVGGGVGAVEGRFHVLQQLRQPLLEVLRPP